MVEASGSSRHPLGEVVRRVWRAPTEDRGTLVSPAEADWPTVTKANQRSLLSSQVHIAGLPLVTFRRQARIDVLNAAAEFTARITDRPVERPSADLPLIVGGHQPDLFHPGVWAKNFAIAAAARKSSGVGLNLIVDHDTLGSPGIVLPTGDREQVQRTVIAWDQPRSQQPWEDWPTPDRELFDSFAARIDAMCQPWGFQPIAIDAWPTAVKALAETGRVVDAFAALRAQQERRWGAGTLELPCSAWARLPSFCLFVADLVARLPEFVQQHNAVLSEYRRLNRARSRSHPVPDLVVDGDWYEAPFWIWQTGDRQRGRLFVRHAGSTWQFRRGTFVFLETPSDFTQAAEALLRLADDGWRLRTRALTTTLFARLGFADLFVHGLGGAKYDEMTDALIERHWGLAAPTFAVVTATLRLPLGPFEPVTNEAIGFVRHQLWRMRQHQVGWGTEEFRKRHQDQLAARDAARAILCNPSSTPEQRRGSYRRVKEITAMLAAELGDIPQCLIDRIAFRQEQQRFYKVATTREASWLTFPENALSSFYHQHWPTAFIS